MRTTSMNWRVSLSINSLKPIDAMLPFFSANPSLARQFVGQLPSKHFPI